MIDKANLALFFLIKFHNNSIQDYQNNTDKYQAGRKAVIAKEAFVALEIYNKIKERYEK